MPSSRVSVILPAAGKSTRFRDQHYKKPFAPLEQKAVWLHAAERFLGRDDVAQVILVISPDDREAFYEKFGANLAILGIEVAEGGAERRDSVRNALAKVRDDCTLVAIHDAARPCLAPEWIDRVFAAAAKDGAAILAAPVTHTLKKSADGRTIDETLPREGLWQAQTPQVFHRQLLIDAYAKLGARNVTDDAQVVEAAGHRVTLVPGSPINLKITTRDDLHLAKYMLQALPKPKLLGSSHPFADGDLWR